MIIECKNNKFLFDSSISEEKAQGFANKIVEFCDENSVDLTLLNGDVFEGILSCPISLTNTPNGIEAKVLAPLH